MSYKADDIDEHFVVHSLYPKLEQELGFKLCLHFRDFVPGESKYTFIGEIRTRFRLYSKPALKLHSCPTDAPDMTQRAHNVEMTSYGH